MVIILLFLAGILSAILGMMVLVGQPKRLVSWLFFGTAVSTALWSTGVGIFLLSDTPEVLMLSAQVYYIAAAGIALCMLLTAAGLVGKLGKAFYVVASLPVAVLAASIALAPGHLIQAVIVGSPNIAVLDSHFYQAYITYFVVYYIATIGYLIYHIGRPHLGKQRRAQLKTVTHAYVWAGVMGMAFNLFLPAIGNYSIIWAGPLCLFIFVPMVYLAIAKHQLFDLKSALVRSSAYIFSLGVLTLLYFGLMLAVSLLLFGYGNTNVLNVSFLYVVPALVLAFVFQPVKQFFDRLTNRLFYRDIYDADEFIASLGALLTSTTRLHDVLELSLGQITRTLKSNSGLFVVYRDHHDDVLVGDSRYDKFTEEEYDLLHRLADVCGQSLLVVDKTVQYDDPDEAKIHRMLARRHVALVLPLASTYETIGYLLLGDQMSTHYSLKDMRVLETIANQLVIAIMNARSVQAVRDLNTHLEERVLNSTRQLLRTNKRLLEMDETKDEFLSMASHQLRTPLTSVKGYISMVLEGDVGDVTPDQRKLLEEAYTSSERMVHLIGDFLNVSRLQTGKFVIDRKQIDLAKVVRQEVDGIRQIATTHDIAISYKPPARFPDLYLDEGKIRQVIMNFIDNAIYYSPEGGDIKVTLRLEDGDAVVRVIDKGMGVPAAVQKRLFTKFFRAENARKQRPDGTGIGLYLAKKVIDGHGGSLVFESKEGKGSTFGFRLPVKKLSVPPPPDPDIVDAT